MPAWIFGFKRSLWVGGIVSLLMAVLAIATPNSFKAEARVLPVDVRGAGGGLGSLATAAAAFGLNVPGGDSGDSNFVDILGSRWIGEKLLATDFQFTTPRLLRSDVGSRETLAHYLHAQNVDVALRKLRAIMEISRDPKTKVIVITAETRSPALSQLIIQRALELLEQYLRENSRTRGGAKVAFAEARLKEAQAELAQVEGAFRRFMDSNRNYPVSTDPVVRFLGGKLEAELKLRQQLVTTLAVNREQSLLEEKNDIPILNIMDKPNLPIEKSRPNRSLMVISAFLVAVMASLSWSNRTFLLEKLMVTEE